METMISPYIKIFNSIEFEKIKDHPNILIAANFWDDARYKAAKTCYKFLRAVDDLIDDHKSAHAQIADFEKESFEQKVNKWIQAIVLSGNDPLKQELIETINKFKIPLWPFEAFAKSMIYDIYHDGFSTVDDFIEYSGGASVAPASIFVHLSGLTEFNGEYTEPVFNLKEASTPCAIFSYLVHIIRDFQKDQLNNLNYFADDIIAKNNLTRKDLSDIARGATITKNFRRIIEEYYSLAETYKIKTYAMIEQLRPYVTPRYQLSLEIIFNLYLMVFERIDVKNGLFTMQELNPTADEIRSRVYQTISKFN